MRVGWLLATSFVTVSACAGMPAPSAPGPVFADVGEWARAAASAQRWVEQLPDCAIDEEPSDAVRLTGRLSARTFEPLPTRPASRCDGRECCERVRVTRFELATHIAERYEARGALPPMLTHREGVTRCALRAWFDSYEGHPITAIGSVDDGTFTVRAFCFDGAGPLWTPRRLPVLEPGFDQVVTAVRAQVAVDGWIDRLPTCPPADSDADGVERHDGYLRPEPSSDTTYCPPWIGACAEQGSSFTLDDPETGRSIRLTNPLHIMRARGSLGSDEWAVWLSRLETLRVTAIGTMDGAQVLALDLLCREVQ